MPDKKISQLNAATTIYDADDFAVVQDGETKQTNASVIKTYVKTGLSKSDVGLGNVDNTSDATKNSAAVTLTNKTINGANNTLSNIGNSSLVNSGITFGSTAVSLGGTVSALNGVSIGASSASTGAFTNLSYTDTLTGGTGVINIGSGQIYKDASGNFGFGTNIPDTTITLVSAGGSRKRSLHIYGGTGEGTAGGIYIESASAAGANGAVVEAIGKRGDTNPSAGFSGQLALGHLRTDAAVNYAGQVLGSVCFGGNPSGTATSNILYSASILGVSDTAWSSSSAMGTALAFYTGSSGLDINATLANPGTERMFIPSTGGLILRQSANPANTSVSFDATTANALTLDSSGVLVLGQGQIRFPATQVPSSNVNTLDDYEEGTYTPTLGGASSNPTVTYTIQTGVYTKIGNLVHVCARVAISATSGGSGLLTMTLPFAGRSGLYQSMSIEYSNLDLPAGTITVTPGANGDIGRIQFIVCFDNAAVAGINTSALTATTNIIVSGSYLV